MRSGTNPASGAWYCIGVGGRQSPVRGNGLAPFTLRSQPQAAPRSRAAGLSNATASPPVRRRRDEGRVVGERRRGGSAARAGDQSARRSAISSVGELDVQLAARSTSITTMSPSRSAASGPPFDASGATWPTMNPCVAPEKRPSVTSATESERPSPTIAAGDVEHLAHAGAAVRALVADHDDVAGDDLAGLDRRERLLLGVEDPGRAAVERAVVAGELDRAALGREVAVEDGDAAARLQRRLDRHDDRLALGLDGRIGDLAERAPVDRARVRRAAGRPSSARAPRARRRRRGTCRSRASGPTASCRR